MWPNLRGEDPVKALPPLSPEQAIHRDIAMIDRLTQKRAGILTSDGSYALAMSIYQVQATLLVHEQLRRIADALESRTGGPQ